MERYDIVARLKFANKVRFRHRTGFVAPLFPGYSLFRPPRRRVTAGAMEVVAAALSGRPSAILPLPRDVALACAKLTTINVATSTSSPTVGPSACRFQ